MTKQRESAKARKRRIARNSKAAAHKRALENRAIRERLALLAEHRERPWPEEAEALRSAAGLEAAGERAG